MQFKKQKHLLSSSNSIYIIFVNIRCIIYEAVTNLRLKRAPSAAARAHSFISNVSGRLVPFHA